MLGKKDVLHTTKFLFFIYLYKYFMSANVIIMEFSKVLRKPTYCIMVSMQLRKESLFIMCLKNLKLLSLVYNELSRKKLNF